jgi:hypothetical protein
MAGLDPAIHEMVAQTVRFPWIPGTRPGMTGKKGSNHLNDSEHQRQQGGHSTAPSYRNTVIWQDPNAIPLSPLFR